MNRLILLTLGVAVAGAATASSITTLFTGGNGGASLWTNYFNATVAANPLNVTGFDVNISSPVGTTFSIDVYVRSGTHVGFETNGGAGWTLVSSGVGNAAGSNNPTFVDVTDFVLNPGLNGIAIRYIGASMSYTNGNGANQNYSNADVSLALGSSAATTAGAFAAGSSLFTPRVWNGTMYYDVVPEPASVLALGAGLAAIAARRRRK